MQGMLEFEDYKVKLNAIRPTLDGLGGALKLDDARAQIAKLQAESSEVGFWQEIERSQKVQKRMKQLQNKVGGYEKLCSKWDDLMAICEMAIEDGDSRRKYSRTISGISLPRSSTGPARILFDWPMCWATAPSKPHAFI